MKGIMRQTVNRGEKENVEGCLPFTPMVLGKNLSALVTVLGLISRSRA